MALDISGTRRIIIKLCAGYVSWLNNNPSNSMYVELLHESTYSIAYLLHSAQHMECGKVATLNILAHVSSYQFTDDDYAGNADESSV